MSMPSPFRYEFEWGPDCAGFGLRGLALRLLALEPQDSTIHRLTQEALALERRTLFAAARLKLHAWRFTSGESPARSCAIPVQGR